MIRSDDYKYRWREYRPGDPMEGEPVRIYLPDDPAKVSGEVAAFLAAMDLGGPQWSWVGEPGEDGGYLLNEDSGYRLLIADYDWPSSAGYLRSPAWSLSLILGAPEAKVLWNPVPSNRAVSDSWFHLVHHEKHVHPLLPLRLLARRLRFSDGFLYLGARSVSQHKNALRWRHGRDVRALSREYRKYRAAVKCGESVDSDAYSRLSRLVASALIGWVEYHDRYRELLDSGDLLRSEAAVLLAPPVRAALAQMYKARAVAAEHARAYAADPRVGESVPGDIAARVDEALMLAVEGLAPVMAYLIGLDRDADRIIAERKVEREAVRDARRAFRDEHDGAVAAHHRRLAALLD